MKADEPDYNDSDIDPRSQSLEEILHIIEEAKKPIESLDSTDYDY